jgi:hypothetical protein
LDAEASWYGSGEPEYRVWPDAAMALGNTDIDIDAAHLRLPWPAFVVTFPRWLVVSHEGVELSSLLVTEVMEPKLSACTRRGPWPDSVLAPPDAPFDQRKLLVMLPHGSMDDLITWKLNLTPGTSIKDEFERYIWDKRKGGDREQTLWLLSIVVCTCFFAVGRSSQSRLLVAAPEPRRRGPPRRIYEVGKEIVLPVYDDTGPRAPGRDGEDTGRSVRSHFRRGHLRWQPYGPRDNPTYELIFIPPTVVLGEGVPEKVTPVSVKLHA